MTALELISLANQVLFVGLFVAVLWHALRQPTRASVNTVLLFGSIAVVVVLARLATLFSLSETGWYSSTVLVALSLAPLAMIRLVDDFSGTPRWVQIGGVVAFGVVAALSIFAFPAFEQLVELSVIVWFLLVGGYAAYAFAREATRTHGITRRRMTAVALGALLFIAAVVLAFVNVLVPTPILGMIGPLLALGAVVAFFLGFAPPSWIRRAWREPDLRHFLERSIHLSSMEDERRALVELQEAAAAAFGATGARIGIAGTQLGTLRYPSGMGGWVEYPDDEFIAGQAYTRQERVVSLDAIRADPEHAAVYQHAAANTVIAAPITAEERRIGVLVIFAERAPIFIEDDLWLIDLLAGQVAVLLDARTLATLAANISVSRGGGAPQGGVPQRRSARSPDTADRGPGTGGAARAPDGPGSERARRRGRGDPDRPRGASVARPRQRAPRRTAARAGCGDHGPGRRRSRRDHPRRARALPGSRPGPPPDHAREADHEPPGQDARGAGPRQPRRERPEVHGQRRAPGARPGARRHGGPTARRSTTESASPRTSRSGSSSASTAPRTSRASPIRAWALASTSAVASSRRTAGESGSSRRPAVAARSWSPSRHWRPPSLRRRWCRP